MEQVEGANKYQLGISAYETGRKILSCMELLELLNRAKPVMERLVRQCDETIYLALPAGREFLLVDKIDTTNPVGIMPLVGRRYPLPQCAAGQVIQAFAADPESSCSTEEGFLSQESLEIIRKRGTCEDVGGLGSGIASLAVPLLNGQRRVLGCLCFVGPQFRFTEERVQCELMPQLKAVGQRLSAQFGCLDGFMA